MTKFLAWLLNLLGGGVVDRVLSHLETKANSETERLKIQSAREAKAEEVSASVVTAGMQHKAFWVPWSICAITVSLWFGWGMLDSLCNGALPDVAALPPQLKQYADIVFSNIFYVGAGGMGVQVIAGAIRGRK